MVRPVVRNLLRVPLSVADRDGDDGGVLMLMLHSDNSRSTVQADSDLTPTPLPLKRLGRHLSPPELPFSPTDFIGRKTELQLLKEALFVNDELPERGVVTVVGPPGVGKTRLALEVAKRYGAAEGVVFFTDLSGSSTLPDICRAAGKAIGVPPKDVDALDEAIEHLARTLRRSERPLLILDNCEHLVHSAGCFASDLLRLSAGLRVLVTTRERLALLEEQVLELESLPVLPLEPRGLEASHSCEAFELFVSRARQIKPDFVPNEGEASDILELLNALDGNPLAIELCAARIGTLGLAEMRRQIPKRFALLRSRGPLISSRWSNLYGALSWSWSLLEPEEQRALAQLSVFRGGWTLEAAEAVLDLDELLVIDILDALREKSLLRVVDHPRCAGERRFLLYDSVRDFAWDQLVEAKEADKTCDRLADHLLETFSISNRASGPQYLYSLPDEELVAECDNLQAVVDRAITADPIDIELALRALCTMAPVYTTRGPYSEYLSKIRAVLAEIGDRDVDGDVLAETLALCGLTETKRGQFARAYEVYQRALALARQAEHRWLEAFIQIKVGGLLSFLYRDDEIVTHLEGARCLVEKLSDSRLEAMLFEEVSTYLFWRSPEKAERQQERARFIFRELGDELREGYTLGQLCLSRISLGRLEAAERCAREAEQLLTRHGDHRWAAIMRAMVAVILQERGHLAEAESILSEALSVQCSVGNRCLEAFVLTLLSDVKLERGRLSEARDGHMKVLEITRPLGEKVSTTWALASLGCAAAALDRIEESNAWFDEAMELGRQLEIPSLTPALELRRGHIDLAMARKCAGRGDIEAANRWLDRARQRLDDLADQEAHDPRRERGGRLALLRFPERVLRQALEHEERQLISGLRVHDQGQWFSVGTGEHVNLARRARPRLLLNRLVEERRCAPGRGVPLDELFEAGWPGEHALPESAANRVYVTLTRMRKLGLGDLLSTSEEGFFLDPSTPLVIESG